MGWLCVFGIANTYAQKPYRLSCDDNETNKSSMALPQPTARQLVEYRNRYPYCNDSTAIKFVRVNIHYILNGAGQHNFQRFSDGWGNSNYNGYQFAEDVINKSNQYWAIQDNGAYSVWQYAGTTDPHIPIRIRVLLNGVYFHTDSYWNTNPEFITGWGINTLYGVDTWNTVNVYMLTDSTNGGVACGFGGGRPTCISRNGAALKMVDAWYMYKRYPAWATTYAADLLNHELGHVFNLYHDWANNAPPRYGDSCQDTREHPNCWSMQDNTPPSCSLWANQSNNMMSYSEYDPALSPCQIARVHDELENRMPNYIHTCGRCLPAIAFAELDSVVCANKNVSGVFLPVDVWLDGRGTFNEDSYWISIEEVASRGSIVPTGNRFAMSYTGTIGRINLRTFCNYTFERGKYYHIQLMASQTGCLPASTESYWIRINDCDILATPTTPVGYIPRTKSLRIRQAAAYAFHLQSETTQPATLYLYNSLGQLLYQQPNQWLQTGDNLLDISNLQQWQPQHVYILVVQTPSEIFSQPFVIQE